MEFGVAEGVWHDAILLDREKDAAEKPMLAEVQIVKAPNVWALAAIEQVLERYEQACRPGTYPSPHS